ncbi:MAG: aminoacyl-tRNA hydrolase [Bdellovibrionales bacterium]|nr:aminoacyl-tRNA hydrolase [Bdellovibrionales bacterium]
MFAIVGLGNPGFRYERTRHNAGAWVVEELGRSLSSWEDKFDAKLGRVDLGAERALLVLPQSYMNLSGGPVQRAMAFYKVDAERLIVCHDELDLPAGALRIKKGGSTAGHQGLNDIKRALGTQDFYRVRVGIGRPQGERARADDAISSWVLGRPAAEEEHLIREAVADAVGAIGCLIEKGLDEAQQRFNRGKAG